MDQTLVGEYRPDWFLGYANAATLSELLGDEEGHYRMAEAAIAADPDNPRAYLELLYLQANSGEDSACLEVADQVISLLPHPIDWPFERLTNSYLMGNLGFCLHINERYDEALRAYQSAEYMGLNEYWLFKQLARLSYYELGEGHEERAVAAGMQALSFDDSNYEDVHIVVASNLYLDRLDEALSLVNQYAGVLDAAEDLGTRNSLGWRLFINDRAPEASVIMEAWADLAAARIEAGETTFGYI